MTDSTKPNHGELVLDLDDVESFKLDLEDTARAESAPFPQRTAPPAQAAQAGHDSQPDQERPTLPPQALEQSEAGHQPLTRESFTGFDAFDPDEATRVSSAPARRLSSWPSSVTLPPAAPASALPSSAPPTVLSLSLWPATPSIPPESLSTPVAPGPGPTPAAPASTSIAPTFRATLAPSPFGRTLPGLPPISQPPEGPRSGGVLTHQRATLRPGELKTEPPGLPPVPSEAVAPRASSPEPALRQGAARPRMYQPPTPQEVAAIRRSEAEEEDDADATQVAAVPRELLEALLAGKLGLSASSNRVTERPPAPPADKPSAPELTTEGSASDEVEEIEPELQLPDAGELLGRVSPPPHVSAPPPPPPAKALPPLAPFVAARPSLAPGPRGATPLAPPPSDDEVLLDLDELLPPSSTKRSGIWMRRATATRARTPRGQRSCRPPGRLLAWRSSGATSMRS